MSILLQECLTCGNLTKEPICEQCGTEITPMTPQPLSSNSEEQEAITPSIPASTPPPSQAFLQLKRAGELTQVKFPLFHNALVGRFHPSSGPVDIDLSSSLCPEQELPFISRHHAKFSFNQGQWLVVDLQSHNKTYVTSSGESTYQVVATEKPQPLEDGDSIAFGNVCFLFSTSKSL